MGGSFGNVGSLVKGALLGKEGSLEKKSLPGNGGWVTGKCRVTRKGGGYQKVGLVNFTSNAGYPS